MLKKRLKYKLKSKYVSLKIDCYNFFQFKYTLINAIGNEWMDWILVY